MPQDAQGQSMTAASDAAARAFDHAMVGYLKYRMDGAQRLAALFQADSTMPLAHVLKGSFAMLSYSAAMLPRAREALADAERHARYATEREVRHIAALGHWIEGDLDAALSVWAGIVADHPHDLLAFRLHHFNAFWLGRPGEMLRAVESVFPAWSRSIPGFDTILACRCFAHEEAGHYTVAEEAGRAAIAMDPGDLWAAHAVAHVMEMQGRRGEGIAWLNGLEPHWNGGSNLLHHLWWHRAMYHLERREFDQVLALYDNSFRNLESPLTQAMPDLYIDVQNAASMLFRLQRHGVDVADRWTELADKAEARIGDCLSAFTLPHWMMALAATGRFQTAARMLDGMREFCATQDGTVMPIVRDSAIPVCEAVLAHARGDHAQAVAVMRPALGLMHRMGGSHAQQDVLEQLFLAASMAGDCHDDARMLLERVAGRHPMLPDRRIGYAAAAQQITY